MYFLPFLEPVSLYFGLLGPPNPKHRLTAPPAAVKLEPGGAAPVSNRFNLFSTGERCAKTVVWTRGFCPQPATKRKEREPQMETHFEKTLDSQVVYQGRVITGTRDTALLENG